MFEMSEENYEKLKSVLRGAVIAAIGAVIPYIAQLAGLLDDGSVLGAILGAIAAVLVNLIRKFALPSA